MENEFEEIALTGGNVNTVVKVGDTVRRNMSGQSKNVHALLEHLEAKDFASPRFLGIDDENREILSYIEGETDFPEDLWDDPKYLVSSAKLLRDFHDASLDFTSPEPSNWAFTYANEDHHDVINHNDFAPYNMVFNKIGLSGIIDFDLCGPGPRSRDIAYLAYWMSPLSFGADGLKAKSEIELSQGCLRLQLLCETYGFDDLEEVLFMVSEVLHHMSDEASAVKMIGAEAAKHLRIGGHFKHWSKEASAFDEKLPFLVSQLSLDR